MNAPDATARRRPLRLWPGLLVAAVIVLMGYLLPPFFPASAEAGQIAGFAGAGLIVLWWVLASRAPWLDRVAAIALVPCAALATRPFVDASIAGGAMGMLPYMISGPPMALALVAWAFLTRRSSATARRLLLPVALVVGSATTTLLRTDGIGGGRLFQLQWRWTPTAEDRLLAQADTDPVPPPAPRPTRPDAQPNASTATETPQAPTASKPAPVETTDLLEPAVEPAPKPAAPGAASATARATQWPGFRGPERNSVVRGVHLNTDWATSPPVALWRRPVGPGWSSFAVDGDLLYTQEQRGDDEIVACYRVSTGEPVWRHRDAIRFYESNGGAGPRGTPTLSHGRVYALGATGLLNALDARTGAMVWSRPTAADTQIEVPTWGISSSPLVVGDVVIVATGGTLSAYDVETGAPRWVGPKHDVSYSSPHLVTMDGVMQVLLLSPPGVVSVAPSDGTKLWEHAWEGGAIVQPAVIPEGGLLISALAMSGGMGVRRLSVQRGAGSWSVQERWTSTGLKPYFNDYVVHNGHAYGFDGSILASIDLADGTRRWKGGRYGSGQTLLLADQNLLLVLAEDGGLALVSATPDAFVEVARVPAIEGKTWNHPVLVGDVLLVRNGEEMAAFKLALSAAAGRPAPHSAPLGR